MLQNIRENSTKGILSTLSGSPFVLLAKRGRSAPPVFTEEGRTFSVSTGERDVAETSVKLPTPCVAMFNTGRKKRALSNPPFPNVVLVY